MAEIRAHMEWGLLLEAHALKTQVPSTETQVLSTETQLPLMEHAMGLEDCFPKGLNCMRWLEMRSGSRIGLKTDGNAALLLLLLLPSKRDFFATKMQPFGAALAATVVS